MVLLSQCANKDIGVTACAENRLLLEQAQELLRAGTVKLIATYSS